MPKASWLDRAVAVFSPQAAMRRLRARALFEAQARAYEGAAGGRRGSGWTSTGTAADAEVHAALPHLRNRMRDLVRNNPHAAKAVSTLVTHIVGDGITGRARTGDPKVDEKVDALWDAHCKTMDADGQLTFAGLQTLTCREMIEGGEALIRKRPRRAADRLPVPLQVQVIESDLLDVTRVGPMQDNDTFAIQGIEFDKIGRRVNYWLFPAHPGNNYLMYKVTLLSVRIPAEDVIHVYEKQRTQVRGVPWGSPVISNFRDLDDYEDAELMRKKIESCSVGVVTGGDELDMGIGVPVVGEEKEQAGVYDGDNVLVERFEPGMFFHLRGGRDVKFHTPAPTGSYEGYKRASLQTIAAGFRIPYELLSGDLAHVSFISGRLGLQEFHRLVSQVQKQIFIPTVCQRLWDWFVEAAITSGALPDRPGGYPVEWSCPPMPSTQPLDDAMADLIRVRGGHRSLFDVIAQVTGRNPKDVLAEVEEANALIDKLKLVLDSDPRAVAKTGALQIVGGGESAKAGDGKSPGSGATAKDAGRLLDEITN